MALQVEHIQWILRELSVRQVPAMAAEQAKQVVIAQMAVEKELKELMESLQSVVVEKAKKEEAPTGDGTIAEAA